MLPLTGKTPYQLLNTSLREGRRGEGGQGGRGEGGKEGVREGGGRGE